MGNFDFPELILLVTSPVAYKPINVTIIAEF